MSHHFRKTSFRISWPLRGEFTGNRWILPTKGNNTELCRFCLSLNIVLNKHSSCVTIYISYTNKHTECPNYIVAVLKTSSDGISLSANVHDLIPYSVKLFRLYTDEWNNKHWGCIDFWYCSLCGTHLIWPSWSIWHTGLKKYGQRGQMAMRVVAWNRACLQLAVAVSVHLTYGAHEIWLTMADNILKGIYRKTIFSNSYSWTRLKYNHDCYVQKFATGQAIYHNVNQCHLCHYNNIWCHTDDEVVKLTRKISGRSIFFLWLT